MPGLFWLRIPLANYGNDTELAYDRVAGDPKKCGGLHVLKLWAAKVPTYGWDFTYTKAPFYFPKMPYPLSSTGSFQSGIPHHRHPISLSGLSRRTVGGESGPDHRPAARTSGSRAYFVRPDGGGVDAFREERQSKRTESCQVAGVPPSGEATFLRMSPIARKAKRSLERTINVTSGIPS